MVLQDFADTCQVALALGSYNEIYVSSHNVSQVFDVKVEEVSDVQAEEEEEDPLLITSPVVKVENEVGALSVCKFHRYTGFCLICIIFIALSA